MEGVTQQVASAQDKPEKMLLQKQGGGGDQQKKIQWWPLCSVGSTTRLGAQQPAGPNLYHYKLIPNRQAKH